MLRHTEGIPYKLWIGIPRKHELTCIIDQFTNVSTHVDMCRDTSRDIPPDFSPKEAYSLLRGGEYSFRTRSTVYVCVNNILNEIICISVYMH